MTGLAIIGIYVLIFVGSFVLLTKVLRSAEEHDYQSLKTITFGDESAVRFSRGAAIISIFTIFLIWAAFTGSVLLLSYLHAPGPFVGETSFTYTAEAPDGKTDDATVTVQVHSRSESAKAPEVDPGDGFAKNDSAAIAEWRSDLINVDKNDEITKQDGAKIIAINGQPIAPGKSVVVEHGTVTLTDKGTPQFYPSTGRQMEPLYLPTPEAVGSRFVTLSHEEWRHYTLFEHLGYSLFRVITGFLLGAAVGIPLGYSMGLSGWFRGWFEPIVQFMRPIPPLAMIPLIIIWFGIGETGKIVLLFLAAVWIMAIAARSGVSGVKISKIHAAYSLGASKAQVLRHVIVPNSLPEIFTGARVAMGVCWGTVVAAELVAAEQGIGTMIMTASKFQNTDIVMMGIILIGVIGFGIDILMRWAERVLVPWKGKG